ncbi:hypothetical protein LIA77_06392 [Sarocladium implicatum]|nr:hypothetical protein LIA77_06392 [Sarocladium implicatum]
MPLFTAELAKWWLGEGGEYITELLDITVGEKPSECGFAQAVQRNLRAFDSDQHIHDALTRHLRRIQADDRCTYDVNLCDLLGKATNEIFVPNRNNATGHDSALLGLGYLDAKEINRLQLFRAARQGAPSFHEQTHNAKLAQELHEAALASYRSFYLSFRVSIMLGLMASQAEGGPAKIRIIANLNALFPTFVPLRDDDDVDPCPCSPGLRSSIRLAVFDNLTAGGWTEPEKQQALSTRLLDWCGILQYEDARLALLRYAEVVRKLEEVLAEMFSENDDMVDITTSPVAADLSEGSLVDRSGTPDVVMASRAPSRCSSSSSSGLPTGRSCETSMCADTHPLFKGMPGRELSASKTDGAAFARDLDAPAVLSYPDDVSREQWSQHPLARSLALSPQEKAFLEDVDRGSDAVSSNPSKARAFFSSRGTSRQARKRYEKDRSKRPLPGIPEAAQLDPAPTPLNRFARRVRLRQDALVRNPIDERVTKDGAESPHTAPANVKIRRSRVLKSQISNPELRLQDDFTIQHSGQNDKASHIPDRASSHTISDFDRTEADELSPSTFRYKHPLIKDKFSLAKPRLSPMEYARMYFLERAMAEREGRECQLVAPGKQWLWSPYLEKFLILPRIPSSRVRNRLSTHVVGKVSLASSSTLQGEPSKVKGLEESHCPRLSLHLGPTVTAFQSLLDLKILSESDSPSPAPMKTLQWSSELGTRATDSMAQSAELDRPTAAASSKEGFMPPPAYPPPPIPCESLLISQGYSDETEHALSSQKSTEEDSLSVRTEESTETVIHLGNFEDQGVAQSADSRKEFRALSSSSTFASIVDSEAEFINDQTSDFLEELRPAPLKLSRRPSLNQHKESFQAGQDLVTPFTEADLPRPDSPTIEVSTTPYAARSVPSASKIAQDEVEKASLDKSPLPTAASTPRRAFGRPHDATLRHSGYRMTPIVDKFGYIQYTRAAQTLTPLSSDKKQALKPSAFASGAHITNRVVGTAERSVTTPLALDITRNRLDMLTSARNASDRPDGFTVPSPVLSAAGSGKKDTTSVSGTSMLPSAFDLRDMQSRLQTTILPPVHKPPSSNSSGCSQPMLGKTDRDVSSTPKPPRPSAFPTRAISRASEPDRLADTQSQLSSAFIADVGETEDDPETPRKISRAHADTGNRTPGRLASVFRRRNAPDLRDPLSEGIPLTPRPDSPWSPFAEASPDDDVFGATWMYANESTWANNDAIIASRREGMMEREKQGQKRQRRFSFGRTTGTTTSERSTSDSLVSPRPARVETTTEFLVDFQSFLDDMPAPQPDLSLPAIPGSKVRSSSRTASGRPPAAPSAAYREKKPVGLSVATPTGTTTTITSNARSRLRKVSKDSLRSAGTSSVGGHGLTMGPFRIGDRTFSLGKKKGPRTTDDNGEPKSFFDHD